LENLANRFDRAAEQARDPREAARQLARLQEGLRQRVQQEVKKGDADRPLADRLKALQPEQEVIRRAVERLSVPPQNPVARQAKKAAAQQAARAAESLEKP